MDKQSFLALQGQEIGVSSWVHVTQERINAFADATNDHQFIHTDPVRSAEAGYGGTIAHGFFTLSLLAAWSDEVLPNVDGMIMSVNYGSDRMRFLSPVPVGSFIRARFIFSSYDEKKPGEVTLRWNVTVEIKDAETPALVADWINRRYFSDASEQTRA
jgi:acyl dehydratase